MGPTWVLLAPDGPHVGPMNLAIREVIVPSTGKILWIKFTSKKTWWRHQMETFSALLAFVRGIHRSPVNSPHKGQWRGALMFSLICAWMNACVNRDAGDLRCHRAHYDITVMIFQITKCEQYIYIYVCMCINLRMYRVAASSSSHAWFLNQPVFLDKYVFPLCRNWSIIMQKIPFHGCCFKIWLKTFLHPVHALSSCYCVFYMTSKSFSHIILINRVVKPIRAIPECL